MVEHRQADSNHLKRKESIIKMAGTAIIPTCPGNEGDRDGEGMGEVEGGETKEWETREGGEKKEENETRRTSPSISPTTRTRGRALLPGRCWNYFPAFLHYMIK